MYGILIASSIIISTIIAEKLAKERALNIDILWGVVFWGVIGGVVGARVYHVITDWNYYAEYPVKVLFIWNGGLGIFGALFGGLICSVLFLHLKKESVRPWLNILGVVFPLGQSIGRWGNFFNAEILGKPMETPFLLRFCNDFLSSVHISCSYRHPVFLYESIATFILFVVLLNLYRKNHQNNVFTLYVIGYSAIRFFIEFFKSGSAPINSTQVLCLALFVTLMIVLACDLYNIRSRRV